jgi:hypothetical protein
VSRSDVRSSKQSRLKIKKNIATVKEALVPGERDDGMVPQNGEGPLSNQGPLRPSPHILKTIDGATRDSALDKPNDTHSNFLQIPGTVDATNASPNALSQMPYENGVNCASIDRASPVVCCSIALCGVISDI